MAQEDLSKIFNTSAETEDMLEKLEAFSEMLTEHSGVNETNGFQQLASAQQSVEVAVHFCKRIVEYQRVQDIRMAALEERLEKMEAENRIRPLAGKVPMKPGPQ